MASLPPLNQPLSDESIALRYTAERDIPEILIAYQDDPKLHTRLGKRRPPSGAELGQGLEAAAAERAQGTRAGLALVELPRDQCRGEITIQDIDWGLGRASLGIWVAPGARGRGLAQRALRLTARWLFEACGLKQLELVTDPANVPMLRAARAAGFVDRGDGSYRGERGIPGNWVALSLRPGDLADAGPAISARESPAPRA